MTELAQMSASSRMALSPLDGTEPATVDEKGRVRLSQKKQERLGLRFAGYQSPLGCLVLYPLPVWQEKLVEILEKPAGDVDRTIVSRQLGAMSDDELRCDAQGRFVIPQRFRDDLKLTGDVVIVGATDRAEIWPKVAHDKFKKEIEAKAQEMREMAVEAVVSSQLL
jgi:MraZ protein